MRSTYLLAHIGLWIAATEAFYPFSPPWLEEEQQRRSISSNNDGPRDASFEIKRRIGQSPKPSSEQAAREAVHLWQKYHGKQSIASGYETLGKRENKYSVMEAAKSGSSLTTGVHQDGADYSYFVDVKLGSPGKSMYMLIDTGAASTWVMGPDCKTEACALHNSFGAKDSETFKDTSRDFSLNYGSGKVSGSLATDKLDIAGMSFTYEFGVADSTSDDFVHFPFDGILGLGMNKGANKNFLEAVGESGDVGSSMFSVYLNRAADGENHGEIRFGSTNQDRYEGDITYTPLGKDNGDWAIKLDDMAYDGQTAGVGKLAYIDTGTSFLFASKESVKKIHALVPGAESSDGMSYLVPCDSNKSLTFTFSGTSFEVSPKDWISPQNKDGKCTSNIYGREVVSGAWLLGDTFLKNVYTVFDRDERRIGFAPHARKSAPNKTTSAPAPGSTQVHVSAGQTSMITSVVEKPTVTSSPNQDQEPGPTLGLSGKETVLPSTETATTDREATESDSPDSSALHLRLDLRLSAAVLCSIASWLMLA